MAVVENHREVRGSEERIKKTDEEGEPKRI